MRVAIIVGHKYTSQGAVNLTTGISEFVFNDGVARSLVDRLSTTSIDPVLVYRRTYKTLPSDVNQIRADFALSLHLNAYDGTANGTEILYHHKSEKSEALAKVVQMHLLRSLSRRDRGIRAVTTEDRGGSLLRYTDCPVVIAEPCFIDNDGDFGDPKETSEKLVEAYTSAIQEYAVDIQS